MKKNKMMRLASVLLIAVILSTCAISGTFAKYTTSADATDTARVAKWGVTITANGTMFADKYDNADNATVVGQGEAKVVAPGTSGTMATMTLTGKPEVKVKVSYEATVTLTGWTVADNEYYCPIVVKVNGEAIQKGVSMDEYKANIKSAIDSYSKEYDAGTDLSGKGTEAVAVTWEWAFNGTDNATDINDTYLGNAANDGNAAEITVAIKTTVTQVD